MKSNPNNVGCCHVFSTLVLGFYLCWLFYTMCVDFVLTKLDLPKMVSKSPDGTLEYENKLMELQVYIFIQNLLIALVLKLSFSRKNLGWKNFYRFT